MKNNFASFVQVILLAIIILLTTFYLFFPRREGFMNEASSTSVYKDSPLGEFEKNMEMLEAVLTDKRDLLQMKRCYQFPNHTMESLKKTLTYNFQNDGMYYLDFDMVTCNFSDIESRIVCELQKFKDLLCGAKPANACGGTAKPLDWSATMGCPVNNAPTDKRDETTTVMCDTKIDGPVYALIFQAPYYRVHDEAKNEVRPLALQFQTVDTQFLPFNGFQSKNDSGVPLFVYVQLLFSKYNKNGTRMPQVDFMNQYVLPQFDRKYMSKENQCFLRAVQHHNLFGGCATTQKPYEATCLGPKDAVAKDPSDEKNTPSTYGILYTLNPKYSLVANMFSEDNSPVTGTFAPPEVFFKKGTFDTRALARNACIQDGADIASVADVQDAFYAGANWCDRGWTSEGYVAKSAQGTSPKCPDQKFDFDKPSKPSRGVFCYGVKPAESKKSGILPWDAVGSFYSKFDWLRNATNKVVQRCGVFSELKYFEKYPDAKESGKRGIQHWAEEGIAKGYDGFIREREQGGAFDQKQYKFLHQDDIPKNVSGLNHFQGTGWKENRRVCLE